MSQFLPLPPLTQISDAALCNSYIAISTNLTSSYPKKHIHAAVSARPKPITATGQIRLAEDVAAGIVGAEWVSAVSEPG